MDDKESLIKWLQENTLRVTFTKTDGSKRVMLCTLRRDLLPKKDTTVESKSRARPESIISVWDLEAKGWRSFKFENVISVVLVDTLIHLQES